MAKPRTATVGLFVHTTNDRDYFQIKLYPVYVGETPEELARIAQGEALDIPETRIRNVGASSYAARHDSKGIQLEDLQIDCQGNNTHGHDRLYAFETFYASRNLKDAEAAMRIAKSLRAIAKGMQKRYDAEGHIESFAQYCRRVAQVIGATRFVAASSQSRGGFTYDEVNHRIMSLGDGVNHLLYLEQKWQDSVKAKTGVSA
jgi:hypothetical protein